jgi:hypothetical protein
MRSFQPSGDVQINFSELLKSIKKDETCPSDVNNVTEVTVQCLSRFFVIVQAPNFDGEINRTGCKRLTSEGILHNFKNFNYLLS